MKRVMTVGVGCQGWTASLRSQKRRVGAALAI